MVMFCSKCGGSVPLADILLRKGKEYISAEYMCPSCGKKAAAEAPPRPANEDIEEIKDGFDLVVKEGEAQDEATPP
jgi:DNA-directed RNA polymerase subunit RPC12/RpoP